MAIQHRFIRSESGWVTIEGRRRGRGRALDEILRERYEHAIALRDARAEAR